MDGLIGPPVGGLPLGGAVIDLTDCDDPFDSAIPLPTSLSPSFAQLSLSFDGREVFGQLSTLTPEPTVPEPSLTALALIAAAITMAARRRQKA
jgi:hypothetical protein